MPSAQRKQNAHRVQVGANTVAGTVGAGFGAAKLRDSFKEDYPKRFGTATSSASRAAIHHGASVPKVGRLHAIAHEGKPGFIPLAIGTTAAALATGAKHYEHHVSKADHKREGLALRRRAHAAISPPPVKTAPVDSSAISQLGYQKQTRRLSVEMKSRPGQPYVYKTPPKVAAKLASAPSVGSEYSREIRGKYKHPKRYSPADRARLFVDPPSTVSKRNLTPRGYLLAL